MTQVSRIIEDSCVFLGCFVLLAGCAGPDTELPRRSDARELYAEYCASCHGARLEGALAAPLVKSDWQYGRDRFSLESNIRHGIPGTDMPGFRNILTDSQIAELATLIYGTQTDETWVADPIPERIDTELYTLRAERLVPKGLDAPWGIEFIDAGTALITENGRS